MAYYLVTGSDVFVGTSVVDVLSQHLNDIPRAPSERMGEAIDPDFEALVLQCLSKHPEARPGSAMALRDRLDSIAEREVWSPKAAEEWWSAWEGSRRNQERGVKLDSKRETRHLTVGLRGSTR
jgi:serine/threonine-protein kinase